MIEPGATLGRYEILAALGRGGMGEVWRARDSKLEREVAIKTLPDDIGDGDEGLERFEREARLLASLSHPNIGGIYGIEEAGGTRFLVLELVEGDTLEDRLESGPIPLAEVLDLGGQLADALDAAHAHEVVHRDLKPANIKITPEGKVKVLDFGLAKALSKGVGLTSEDLPTLTMGTTQQGSILGTPSYMSPEQARGEQTDQRTDIWAFGCILFEMITGQRAFGGSTLTDALASVIARDPNWRILPPDVHPRIRLLLERCLDKDLHRRYRNIAEARADIDATLGDPQGIYAAPGAGTPRPSSFLPWTIAGAAVVGLLLLAGVTLFESEPADTVVRLVASTYPSPPVNGGNSNLPLVAISPDGSQVAYPAVLDDQLTIYLRDVGSLSGRRLRPEGTMAAPFYSPDGLDVGFMNPSETALKRVSLAGTEPPQTLVTYDDDTVPFGAAWGEDGRIAFALLGDGRGLIRIPDRGGPSEEITELGPNELEHLYPDVLPGGRGVLFTTITSETTSDGTPVNGTAIEVLDLETRERRTLIQPGTQAQYVDGGIMVYNDEGSLYAVRFDANDLEIEGTPVLVQDNVEYYPGSWSAQFDVSRNGSLVYMNRTSLAGATERRLALVDLEGNREPLEMSIGPYMHPRVSPDGSEIAVQTLDSDNQGIIWIYNFERTALRQLTRTGSNVRPIWTPDGERIAFASNRDETWGIYWQRADGSDVATRLTRAEPGWEHHPDSFSPDGDLLTFTDINPNQAGLQTIWALDLTEDGAEPFQLTEPASGGLNFSIEGDWVAYRLDAEVVVEQFPQTGVLYQVTQAGGSSPVWSPDGTRLLYRRAVGSQGAASAPLVTVDVETNGVFTFGNEYLPPINGFLTFFGYRDYDFMPEGDELVMVFPSELDEVSSQEFVPRVNVVLHWVEEIEDRLLVE